MTTIVSTTKVDLSDFGEATQERFHRASVVRANGLQVLHLTLAPGQAVPSHNHPGQHVLLQGLKGVVAVNLNNEAIELHPGDLLHFSGEQPVSLRNDSGEPCAVLITLAKGG